MLVKDEPKPKYEVDSETAVPWKQPEWADFYNAFTESLTSNLNITEREAAAVGRLLVSLSAWREEMMWLHMSMMDLEGEERCNGVEELRKKGVLYIRHGVGGCCPMHGAHENGRRKVVYVGTKDFKQAQARDAITRQDVYVSLTGEESTF